MADNRVALLATTALRASLEITIMLARKGLIAPDEVDELAEQITDFLRYSKLEGAAGAKEMIDDIVSGPLADAKQHARQNWRG